MIYMQLLASTTEEPHGIAALGLDPIALLAQGVTFVVLFFVIKKFALKSIVQKLEERRNTIERGLSLSTEMDSLKADMDAKLEAALVDAKQESARIVADAHKEAGALMRQAEDAAVVRADGLLADAAAKIERDIAAAQAELKREIVGLVVATTEAVLQEKLDTKRDTALIEQALAEAARGQSK